VLQSDGTFKHGEAMQRKMEGDPEIELLVHFWCPPATYLFHRDIVKRVGGWNERLSVTQDARFTLDCALHGATFSYCRGIMAYYRIHSQESLSRRDPDVFFFDCLRSAREVEDWFLEHGGVTSQRRSALIKVYEQVARTTFENHQEAFETALAALERLSPGGYRPSQPKYLALASKIVGYRQAEALAVNYRKGRRFLKSVARPQNDE